LDADLPTIKATSPLPSNFKEYKFLKIEISQNNLRKQIGNFRVLFKTKKKVKKIYFRFNINAKIDIFKAKHKLYNDKILTQNDYEKVSIKLDKLPSKIITCKMPERLITKNYISVGSVLTMNKFRYKKDVLRGTHVKAYLKDGALVLETEATVLRDANVGEIVKIKTANGKLFRAKIISNYKAIILE